MDAFDELSQYGEIGPATYALLLDRVRREVRRRGYPTPHAGGTWTEDDYIETVHELVSKRRDLTLSLLATADQNALTALLTTIVRNFLIDQAKKSDVGKLSGRLQTLMRADPRFVEDVHGRWGLTASRRAPTTTQDSELEAAAWVPRGLTLEELPKAGPTPGKARVVLLTVSEAVLTAADGTVDPMTLARAVGRRFGLVSPIHSELPEQPAASDQGQALVEPSDDLLAVLDNDERTALRASTHAGGTAAVARALGCGRTRAEAILQRAIAKARATVAAQDVDADEVLSTLDSLTPLGTQPNADRSSSTNVNPAHATHSDRTR